MTKRLHDHPRVALCHLPTRVERLARISDQVGREIWVKRDDMTGLAFGGNKARKLEYIIGEAQAQGADWLLTAAGVQSNHARQTAAAAAKFGMGCELVLARMVPYDAPDYELSGNVLLDQLLGARVHIVPRGTDVNAKMAELAERARSAGRSPYIVPFGGSAPPGTFGYVNAALEILEQMTELGERFHHVVHATGSAGTQAGLICGFASCARAPKVWGISVLAKESGYRDQVAALATVTAEALDMTAPANDASVVTFDCVGEHYGIPTIEMREALGMVARQEGLLLDPVYTGKAFAGLLSLIRSGAIERNEKVLFIHTGGTPALFPYRASLVPTAQVQA